MITLESGGMSHSKKIVRFQFLKIKGNKRYLSENDISFQGSVCIVLLFFIKVS
jgi:hypothetical protein